MSVTPIHPNLMLDRPLTRDEMLEAVRYEGMFGFGPQDYAVAEALEAEGLVELDWLNGHRTIVNLEA